MYSLRISGVAKGRVNTTKQFPPHAAPAPGIAGPLQAADEVVECNFIDLMRGGELGRCARAFGCNSVAPALGCREAPLVRTFAGSLCRDCRPNRTGIGAAHQLADQLLLPPHRTTLAHRAAGEYGISECRIERQLGEAVGWQTDEAFAELLQLQVDAFARRFAGLCVSHRLSYRAFDRPSGRRQSSTVSRNEDNRDHALRACVELALEHARDNGVSQAEVAVSEDSGLTTTARQGDVETLEHTRDRGIGITVYRDGRKGSASTSELSPGAIREAVDKACGFARHTEVDSSAGLADAELMCREFPDLDLDRPWDLDARTAIETAIRCEAAALEHDVGVTNTEGATLSSNRGVRAYGNTHGFFGCYAKTAHSLSCVAVTRDGDGLQRDYYYSSSRGPAGLESADDVGRESAARALRRVGARKISTTRAPVLFVPELARGFIGHAVAALHGGAQYRKASFLLGAVGERVFPRGFAIDERPHLPGAMASRAYDAEGVATSDRKLVADGVLEGYVLGSYSARRLGLQTTGNAGGPHNLIVAPNAGDFESICASMPRGLVVTELIGQGVNGVTGDYSRGAVGYWVENGSAVHPVHEVTIAGNLRELYARILAVGEDVDIRGRIRCGSVLVDDMAIAGN